MLSIGTVKKQRIKKLDIKKFQEKWKERIGKKRVEEKTRHKKLANFLIEYEESIEEKLDTQKSTKHKIVV